jgi:hypothetical protein
MASPILSMMQGFLTSFPPDGFISFFPQASGHEVLENGARFRSPNDAMHQTCRSAGGGANTNTPPQVASHGTCGAPDHGTPCSANSCAFGRGNTCV